MFYEENTETVCQCCLKIGSSEVNLTPIYTGNVEIGKINKKIYELFNTFADDSGIFRECQEGSMICDECLKQLIDTTNFYQKCVQTQTLIRMKRDLDLDLMPVREYQLSNICEEEEEEDPILIRIPTPPVVTIPVCEIINESEKIFQKSKEDLQMTLENTIDQPKFFFECFKCVRAYETQSEFLIHFSEAHEVPCITCQTCGAVFDNTIDSDSHRLKHYIKNDFCYTCLVCTAQFPSPQALENHSLVHSTEIYCQICLKPFDDYPSLYTHLCQHIDQRVLPCIYCSLQFRTSYFLNEHITEIHDDRRFRCHEGNCREGFANKDMLRKHQMEVHEEIRERYNCRVCKTTFKYKNDLTDHLETHLNGNKFIPVHTTTGSCSNNNSNNNNNNNNYRNNYQRNHHKQGNYNDRRSYDSNNNNNNNKNRKNMYNDNQKRHYKRQDNHYDNHRQRNDHQRPKKPVKRLQWNEPSNNHNNNNNNKANVYSRLG